VCENFKKPQDWTGAPRSPQRTWDEKDGRPGFPVRLLDTTACAAFIKESRMKCINAHKLHRKSGKAQPLWLIRRKAFEIYRCRPVLRLFGVLTQTQKARWARRRWRSKPHKKDFGHRLGNDGRSLNPKRRLWF
jgi:hypothetical protein